MESAHHFSVQTWLQHYCRCSFFDSAYLSSSNTICLRTMRCWRTMIPGKIFTSFAKFPGIFSVNDFRFPIWLQELLQTPLCFLRSFCFARIRLDPLGGQVLHHDCVSVFFEIRNCRSGPCDLLLSSHQIFQHEVRLRHCVFCMGPYNFGPLTDLAISVFREMRINTVLTQILTSLECGL